MRALKILAKWKRGVDQNAKYRALMHGWLPV